MLLAIFLLALGIALLYFGGEWLVSGSVGLAKSFNLSSMVIGLTVVAFGTSCPELAASLAAALGGSPDIAVGNVFGSNVANISLILGICALIMPFKVTVRFLRREVGFMIFATAIVYPLMVGGLLNRVEGILLVTCLCAFLIYLLKNPEAQDEHLIHPDGLEKAIRPVWLSTLAVVAGVVLLVSGAKALVSGAVTIATALGISERVIGFTVVAFGTSLPELAASVVAARKGEGDIILGNLVGSNIFNLLSILGLTAIVVPIPVSAELMGLDFWAMFGVSVLLLVFLMSKLRLSRVEGVALLVIYVGYCTFLFVQG